MKPPRMATASLLHRKARQQHHRPRPTMGNKLLVDSRKVGVRHPLHKVGALLRRITVVPGRSMATTAVAMAGVMAMAITMAVEMAGAMATAISMATAAET